MLIGSEFAMGAGEAKPVINPKTGAKVVDLSEAAPEQVDKAVAAAAKAFESGRARRRPSGRR